MSLVALTLREPFALLLVLLPLAARLLARRRFVALWAEPALRPWAVRTDPEAIRRRPLLVAAWLLLAIAAAGPRLPLPGVHHGQPDRSDVALMAVVQADTFPAARLELHELAALLRGERLGLVAYGEQAGLVSAPTSDMQAFGFYRDLLPRLEYNSGEGLPEALTLAASALPVDGSRALLVLAAGPISQTAETVAARIAAGGTVVHILALSADPGLARLASAGEGLLVPVQAGDGDWMRLYDQRLARLPSNPVITDASAWRELYPWFLAPALGLFLLGWFPLSAPLVLALAVLGLGAPQVQASESLAWEAFQAGRYASAGASYTEVPGYAGRFGEGASAYRRGDYPYAVEQFQLASLIAPDDVKRADALHNLGNAALHTDQPALAVDAYRASLELREDAHTRHNLDVAEGQLAGFLAEREQGPRPGRNVAEYGQGWDPEETDFPEEQARQETSLGSGAVTPGASPSGERPAWQEAEQDYRAGLKKLELVEDRPASLLRGLMAQEALQ